MKIGRNDPCPCGSGKKYKKCCSAADDAARAVELAAQQEADRKAADEAAAAEAANPSAPPPRDLPPTGRAPRRRAPSEDRTTRKNILPRRM